MKIARRLKRNLYLTMIALYSSGATIWVLETFCKRDRGLGLEAPPAAASALHLHGILGLWFLLVFGYLWRSHIETNWRAKKKRRSGALVTAVILILILTVPGLYYLANEQQKAVVSFLHTYLGLALPLPFFLHYFTKVKRK